MVDVSDRDFRMFMRLLSSKCEVWTEMLVDQALVHNEDIPRQLEKIIGFTEAEHPIVCQLGGHDPSKLAAAARIAHRRGYDEVNLNVGCPSSRVAGHGLMGVALMKTPELVRDCLRTLDDEVPHVSIKTRLGVDDLDTEEFTRSFLGTILPPLASSAAQQPYRVIMHCRKAWLQGLSPAENRTVPPLDYPRACRVLGAFGSRVRWTLNGGIETLWQAKDVLTSEIAPANLEGVMIGRAAYNNPCMLHDADVYLYGCDENPVSAESRGALLEAYADYLHDRYPLESDSPLTPGTFATSLKPTLGTFANKSGNRMYRHTIDGLIKAHKRDREVGPGDVVRMAMREMPEELLWEPLPSTVDIEEAERAERQRMVDWQRQELDRRRIQYAKKEATQRARVVAAKAAGT
ncbi:tRNA-dihydrouridine synthase A, putative [Perkinsus marinus ATCC 50983]|uniref:tRNA-dihydrouridine synthase A, putative n=1 Tax=Perkinsus marinus (strain ATCC 50983 / TXsc) TaxID=423536 RepID=C5KTF9_PERM5|nr:tRNA-dihydrouridine synthase A, putative [Perkinsus marinus ATCC 50983]EER12264.1 tRNA-dihydrouridine synthase A, putative [Perkinsus marinus ATCC 50983]|eukprot:XP_002780469.1 tRNA-dihydrouridine synthase A, putative [Perkinsus marinus ATCC 50983]